MSTPVTHERQMAYVALGSNLGDRHRFLADARVALAALPDTRILAVSSIEETAPLGGPPQGAYLNQMVALETALSPHALLDALQRIERAAGRVRRARWEARQLDLDIVRYGDLALRDERLTIPHPGLESRAFWMREMSELHAALAAAAR